MNIRSLTRGDGVVIGAGVLLLIFSFLPFLSADLYNGAAYSVSAWNSAVAPAAETVHLPALLAAALFVLARSQPTQRSFAGLTLPQWATALAVFSGWSAVWSVLIRAGQDGASPAWGAWISLLLALVAAAAAVLSPRVPALQAALVAAPRPQPAGPYGAGPGAGYGYPGGPQQGYPGVQGQQPGAGYGYPGGPQQGQQPAAQGQFSGQQQYGAQAQQQPQPAQAQQPQGGTAGGAQPTPTAGGQGGAEFAPFWFAVPVQRPLYGEDGSPAPIAELAPGTWYLAVDQRGAALVAQTQDGRRGVLQDTTGIQRG
ncbi:hypothetical protein ACFV3R_15255 [Streptomyces sp. NPDC059740]|uniref:hypothetical protein n=1 Tax=Streptomyces sp. NPDC059740 TaxID=3346926 RepID=UPI003647B2A3